ncbi:hypothetical protein [Acidianus brierleyi]|uniref:Uncharacterized protein n=1 Tax=Acidianus brierleyi TaxID=41673 RepID=A0A2U9IC96_9CREN|nr:hypothetical protein [Acidianus brierleyi]AWR93614.1 hypothetical protein DFR85_02310 [Acidianus brierleyi]
MQEELENPLSKSEKIFAIFLVILSIIISYLEGNIPLYLSICSLSVFVLLYRFYSIVKMLTQNKYEVNIIPKVRYEKTRFINLTIIVMLFLFVPFALLYLLPLRLWITATLGIISLWPISSLLASLIIYKIERKFNGRLFRYYIIEEKLGEVVIKEYGYKIIKS